MGNSQYSSDERYQILFWATVVFHIPHAFKDPMRTILLNLIYIYAPALSEPCLDSETQYPELFIMIYFVS